MTDDDEPRVRATTTSASGSPPSTTRPPSSARSAPSRAGLADYELDEEDLDLPRGVEIDDDEHPCYLPALPVLAIVGRPNVGKSALVNRILGRREAVVEDTPGVTRDRVTYQAEWNGRRFTLVDTGGWEPDASGIDASVAAQAEIAIDLADAVLFVVDATVGATATDEHVVRMLRADRKPVVLAANKVDDARQEPLRAELWSLGLGEPWPVSALHGRGVADLLDDVLKVLPRGLGGRQARGRRTAPRRDRRPPERRQVLPAEQGRAGGARRRQRARRHHPRPRRRADRARRQASGASSTPPASAAACTCSRAPTSTRRCARSAALEKAEVAVVVLDVSQPISEQDVRIIDLVLESGRALVLAYNKWDLLDDDRRRYLEREIEQDLAHVSWAPRVNISARTGRHLEKLVPALETRARVVGHPHPDRQVQRVPRRAHGRAPAPGPRRQAAAHPVRHAGDARRPPTFVLFTTGFLDPGYRRYISRRLREVFGFEGTPDRRSTCGCGSAAPAPDRGIARGRQLSPPAAGWERHELRPPAGSRGQGR